MMKDAFAAFLLLGLGAAPVAADTTCTRDGAAWVVQPPAPFEERDAQGAPGGTG